MHGRNLNISALIGLVLRVLAILSLFSLPLSMSHAAMESSEVSHSAHTAMEDVEHSEASHSHDHSKHVIDVDSNEGHHGENCCSSICSGDVVVEYSSPLIHFQSDRFAAQHEKPQTSGEWVTPYRPPSL